LFADLEFTALAREFGAQATEREVAGVGQPAVRYEVVLDPETLRQLVARMRATGSCALSVESDAPEPMRGEIVGIALASPGVEAIYLPLGHRRLDAPRQIERSVALDLLRPILEDARVVRMGHDTKKDLILLRRSGVAGSHFAFDTMIAGYLLNSSRKSYDLDVVAQEASGLVVRPYESILGSGARRSTLADVEIDRAAALLCERAAAIGTIAPGLRKALEADELLPLLEGTELPLTEVLADMEATGVRIDSDFLAGLSSAWEAELTRLTEEIHRIAGREFNINSPQQLGEILFEELKLQPGRRTEKTRSFSTSVEVLEDLAGSHDLPRRLLDYRSLQKLKSTYVDALPKLVNPATGRLHTSFNQAVAATGRLSSSDPNLQNIPIRTDVGRQIRRAFIPSEGCLLLSADYSQIELRVLAHLSGDPGLIAAFRGGEDIHRRTAAEIFGVLPDLVSDEMRRRAKAINFGILYGMGPQRLARDQGIPLKEASEFIERYFRRFPGVKHYIDSTIAAAEREGRVRTLFRRLRHFPELKGSDRNARQQAVRAAVNTTIQGTAADLIKMAMVVLDRRLREKGCGARMTLQVHDELVLEVPKGEVVPVAALVREVMETIHPLAVDLLVDLHVGPNWLEMEEAPGSKD
ncbi:MAG TPA: DNA polymerase I, partial [Candidatus Polarisedimenticolia bacterium]|nr:DNA polymerase I [Candidatus Polarisedimenticolia bacterium]